MPYNEIFGLLRQFIITKNLNFFPKYAYRSLIWTPKLDAPKIDQTMSKSIQNSACTLCLLHRKHINYNAMNEVIQNSPKDTNQIISLLFVGRKTILFC